MQTELIQKTGTVHDKGASFAFEKVGNADLQIHLSKLTRADGSVRWYRDCEQGPFGRAFMTQQSIARLKPEWRGIATALLVESYRLLEFVESGGDHWAAQLTDVTGKKAGTSSVGPATKPEKPKKTPKGKEANAESQ